MKKAIVSVFAFLCCVAAFGQAPAADYYLNGVKFDFDKLFFNPNRIESIDVVKDTPPGGVYIKTKTPFTGYSLARVLQKHTNVEAGADVLFIINDVIVADTTGVRIDDTLFIYPTVRVAGQAGYLPEQYKKLVIVSIELEMKERKPEITIR